MNILGLSFDYHDSAAALIKDGRVIAAAQEEAFSRKKHDAGFPEKAVFTCLEAGGITAAELDAVVFHENTMVKFSRIVEMAADLLPDSTERLSEIIGNWIIADKFDPHARIAARLGVPLERIHHVSHHQAHAASAFYSSPFQDAVIVTMDGVGEHETTTVSLGRGVHLEKIRSISLPDSLGLFYSAFTAFLGFEVNEGEYKVMGMAGYGQPRFVDIIAPLIQLNPDGGYTLDQRFFSFRFPSELPYTDALVERLGPSRAPESAFDIRDDAPDSIRKLSRHYADIAASVQQVMEDAILHMVRHAINQTGMTNVCLAGGVALNSLANARIKHEIATEPPLALYVHPAAGDAGGALGAALFYHHEIAGGGRVAPLSDPYLGAPVVEADVWAAIERHGISASDYQVFQSDEDMTEAVAELLAGGAVVGWMQGRAEWGPRALGNRSILANPTLVDMQRTVNVKIKFREPFRPFAPSVLSEEAHRFFEMDGPIELCDPENFMLLIARVREGAKALLPAITHVDGTARLQTVRSETNPLYHALIKSFGRRTGVPMLLNTSFNLRGQPMVGSPVDALDSFYLCDMDYVCIGRTLFRKERL